MPLGFVVTVVVLAAVLVVGAAGYLIDKSAERDERKEDLKVSRSDEDSGRR
jgi:hypothetical protein